MSENTITIPDLNIFVGDFYQSCDYHPRLAISVNYEENEIAGISLVDGKVRSCLLTHCGVFRLTKEQAIQMAIFGIEFSEEMTDVNGENPSRYYELREESQIKYISRYKLTVPMEPFKQ